MARNTFTNINVGTVTLRHTFIISSTARQHLIDMKTDVVGSNKPETRRVCIKMSGPDFEGGYCFSVHISRST